MRTLAQSRPVLLARDLLERSRRDDVYTHPAAPAYQMFLSFLAVSLVTFGVLGLVGDILDVDVPQDARSAYEHLLRGRLAVSVIGIAAVLLAASGLNQRATLALREMFRADPLGGAPVRLRALATTLGLVLVLMLLPVATGVLSALEARGLLEIPIRAFGFLGMTAPSFGVFLLAYRTLTPTSAPGWRGHVPGALLMTVGWEIARHLGSLYFDRVIARATFLYGAIGAIVGVLIILHLAALAFFYGAGLSAFLLGRRHEGTHEGAA